MKSTNTLQTHATNLCLLLLLLILSCAADNSAVSATYERALELYSRNDLTSAQNALQDVLKDNPDHINARIMLGKILYYNQNYEEAETAFTEAVNQDDNKLDAVLWLAKTRTLLNKTDEGMRNIDHFISRDSNNIEAWYIKGLLHEQKGDTKEAMAAYSYAISKGQHLALVHMRLANIYKESSLPDMAQKHFRMAAAITNDKETLDIIDREGTNTGHNNSN